MLIVVLLIGIGSMVFFRKVKENIIKAKRKNCACECEEPGSMILPFYNERNKKNVQDKNHYWGRIERVTLCSLQIQRIMPLESYVI